MPKKILNIIKIVQAFLLMTIMGTTALLFRIVSFGLLTNFNRKYYVAGFCRFILWSIGIKLENKIKYPQLEGPHFYTFNHNSFLDGFVLFSLGLTKTRFLLSEKMLGYIPATLTALSMGVLYIPMKKNAARRLRFFINLEKRLKREKIGFAGSSEGVHEYIHGICPFNRGVYHTAMLCKMPVVAIFIYTPEESNPLNKFKPFVRGKIVVECMEIIPTTHWKLENLDQHIEEVRDKFVSKYNLLYNASTV